MRRLLVVATAVAMLTAGGAFAGEVKGPPGTTDNTNDDRRSGPRAVGMRGQRAERLRLGKRDRTMSQVQTAADSWKYYGLPKGSPGTGSAGGIRTDCRER